MREPDRYDDSGLVAPPMTIADQLRAAWDEADRPIGVIEFTVRGLPAAQGSARAFIAGKGAKARAILVTDANRRNTPLGAWRSAVRTEAASAMGARDLVAGPVSLAIDFLLPRPKSHLRSNGMVKPSAPQWHSGRPDGDKLLRAALDSMTGIVFGDDAQVAEFQVSKRYASQPGCRVTVSALR